MADTLTLKEVELDYEADEAEDNVTPREEDTPTPGLLQDGELPSSPAPENLQTDDINSPGHTFCFLLPISIFPSPLHDA